MSIIALSVPESRVLEMMNNISATGRLAWVPAAIAVAVVVLVVYWPALSAGYVWDDILTFQQRGWLYHGDDWKKYIFTGFNEWELYFRPLVVALFVLQVRVFGGDPAGMHAVTLGMHLVNVGLVILLSRALSPKDWRFSTLVALLAGLIYGLHPMLVETVVWIGCQFDQMQVMTMLLGLLAAHLIKNPWLKAIAVSLFFMLSALSKESAAAFPALVFLFDWLLRADHGLPLRQSVTKLLRDNALTYAGLMAAGVGYLFLRHHMMGSAVAGLTPEMLIPDIERVETVAYVYLKYWMVVFGVPTDLNPLHAVGSVRFGESTPILFFRVIAGLGVLACGLLAVSKRLRATGVLVVSITLYLLPVLGVIPITFDESIYHERYAIGAVMLVAVLLPRVFREWADIVSPHFPALVALFPFLVMIWLAWAVVNVRVTIPLWSDNLALWEWAVRGNPESTSARANLIGAYIMYGENERAKEALQEVVSKEMNCPSCYINGFILAVGDEGDLGLAEEMVSWLRDSPSIFDDKGVRFLYLRTAGHLELRLGNYEDAADLLEAAIELEGHDSHVYMLLAETEAAREKISSARKHAEKSLAMSSPVSLAKYSGIADRILRGEVVYGKRLKGTSKNPHSAAPRRQTSPPPPSDTRPLA